MPVTSFEFGDFKLDFDRFELCRAGRTLRLERKPMELLILLVARNGALVTRTEIAERLWGEQVFVDIEHGINTAVRKIRHALRDDPDQPRYVQTVTGKGYRFIAPINEPNGSVAGGNGSALLVPSAVATENAADQAADVRGRHSALHSKRNWYGMAALLVVAAVGMIAAVVLGIVFWRQHLRTLHDRANDQATASRIHSLAVLPLQNLSGDPGQEYFADGMTDEIITMLAKNTGLRVISRTSAMQYKNAHLPLPEVARQLGVDGILEGSVGRSGNRVHVNVQLVNAATDSHAWAESYDRDLSDVGALESQLATTIAEQVGLTVSSASAPPRQIKPEAHDAYLWGRYYWFGFSPKSGEYFQKAIDLQPDYAAAWSGLADSLIGPAVVGTVLPAQVVGRAESAARKALELDPQLGDAHRAMAAIKLFGHWDYKAADRESARAVELDPQNSENHHLRSYVLDALGRIDEALQEERLASELDPRLRPWAMADALIRLHRFDDAIQDTRARLEADPQNAGVHEELADAYRLKGMDKQSAEEWEKGYTIEGEKAGAGAARHAAANGSMQSLLEWQLARDQKKSAEHYFSPYDLALDYGRLKRKQDTLRSLEQAYQQRVAWTFFLGNEPDFDFVHSESRYQAIVTGMKLPPVH